MVEAIIFDMDGVLIDSEPYHLSLDLELLRRHGIEMSKSEHDKIRGMDNLSFFKRVVAEHKLDVLPEQLLAEKNSMMLAALQYRFPHMPGIEDLTVLLKQLGLLVAVASSSYRVVVDYVLERLHWKHLVSCSVCGDEVTIAKPDPQIYVRTAAKLGVLPLSCAVVEDSTNGILSAKKAGMSVIAYCRDAVGGQQDVSLADFSIYSFDEIGKVLCRIV
ncbi:MAG: HAD family phosphatase [Spirochaetia bacterium]|jgi:HAD superfamily hydrolase (TIGR01509 family)|nr:HAD family phosphatase [Spirochaetia bacterium]